MQNNLIPQISHGRVEMKGEETNIRIARGSNNNTVEEKRNKETEVCTRTRGGDAAVQIHTGVIHTWIDESTPPSLGIRTSYKVLIMEGFFAVIKIHAFVVCLF